MQFPQITIKKDDDPKGREFSAHLVGSIVAPEVLPEGKGTKRPLLLAYAGTSSAVAAFTANLRSGLSAETRSRRYELLKSLGYRYEVSTPERGRTLVIAYLPDLFHVRGGEADPVRFVSAPPAWWLDEQEVLLAPEFGSLARDHARALAWVIRLDARSPLPIANDPRFHHALYERALDEDWMSRAGDPDFWTFGMDRLGLEEPVLCDVGLDELTEFLSGITAELLPQFVDPTPQPRRIAAAGGQLALGFSLD